VTSSPSLFRYLDAIRQRPGMYTGADSHDWSGHLDRIEMLVAGYLQAVMVHGVRDRGMDVYCGFSEYLGRRFGWNVQGGPIRTIRRESGSDDEAWEMFWRLLSEFRDQEGAG
jgi:hypothetical protein